MDNVKSPKTTHKTTTKTTHKTTTKTTPKLSLAEYIRQHSPVKKGIQIKDDHEPFSKVDKIMKNLYLGNFQAAKDKNFFKSKKIKAVLNCTKSVDIPNHFANNKDIEYMRIPVDDSLKEKDFSLMLLYMPSIVEFIHKHVTLQKHNILVHCYAGKQRSAISVAAYLVAKHNMTPHEACKLIIEKRPEAFHYGQSLNFDQALKKFYKNICKK